MLISLIKSIINNLNILCTTLSTLRTKDEPHNDEGEIMIYKDYEKYKHLHDKFCIPVWRQHRVTSPFGPRVLENGDDTFHKGIDFVSKYDINDVFAVYDGKVTYDQDNYDHDKRWLKGHTGGNMIILKHRIDGEIYYSRYLHLGSNNVSVGDIVYKGNHIGVYGNYGKSYGAHLHFDLWTKKWVRIDPTLFFKNL